MRTSSVSIVAPRAIASRVSTSSRRVPIFERCHRGSTAMVVTCASSSVSISPAYPTSSRSTRATRYTRVERERELGQEQRVRPRVRVHLLLDAQHRPHVTTAHRLHHDREGPHVRFCGHHRAPASASARWSQAISASLRRRYSGSSSSGCSNSSRSTRAVASSTSAADARRREAAAGELDVLERRELGRRTARRRRRRAAARASRPRARPRARRARPPCSRRRAAHHPGPAGTAPRTPPCAGRRSPRRSGGRSGATGTRRDRGSGSRPRGCEHLGQDLGRGDAHAQPGEEPGPVPTAIVARWPEVDGQLPAQVVDRRRELLGVPTTAVELDLAEHDAPVADGDRRPARWTCRSRARARQPPPTASTSA